MEKNILIVGQGLAGTLLGYRLFKNGFSFSTVDLKLPGSASIPAAGVYNPVVFRRMLYGWRAVEMLQELKIMYQEMEVFLNTKFHHPCGLIKLLSNEESANFWNVKRKENKLDGWLNEAVKMPADSKLNHYYASGLLNEAGYIHTETLLDAWRRFLENQSCLLEEVVDYTDLIIQKQGIEYHGVMYHKVVFCDGWRVVNNPYFNYLPHVPTKGEGLLLDANELPQWGTSILNAEHFVIPHYEPGLHWAGSNFDWNNINPDPDKLVAESILNSIRSIFKSEPKVIRHISGIRPGTPDRRPYLLQHSQHKNLYLFNGLGAKGVFLAPLLSLEMLNLLSDKQAL